MNLLNFPEMLSKARQMQEQMQRQMSEMRVEASSGGGMVLVVMNGQKYILSITIDPQLLKDGDVEVLQDLVSGAVNQAAQRVDEQLQSGVGSLLNSLNLPKP